MNSKRVLVAQHNYVFFSQYRCHCSKFSSLLYSLVTQLLIKIIFRKKKTIIILTKKKKTKSQTSEIFKCKRKQLYYFLKKFKLKKLIFRFFNHIKSQYLKQNENFIISDGHRQSQLLPVCEGERERV